MLRRMLKCAREFDEKLGILFWVFPPAALAFLGFRTRLGWLFLIFIAAALGAIVYALGVEMFSGHSRVDGQLLLLAIGYLVFLIVVCIAFVVVLARRRVQRQRPGWKQIALLGKVLYALFFIACGVIFYAPFAWIAWRAMSR